MEIERLSLHECWSEKNYEESLQNENYKILVAKQGTQILGFVSMYSASGEGYICNIAVNENVRNQGIGSILMQNIIDYSKTINLRFLSLEVRESNHSAIKFYEKFNFINQGARKNFYSAPIENAIIMTKFFETTQ